jgi:hypothetical protein
MPGIGEEIDGAMQQAPQPARQAMPGRARPPGEVFASAAHMH